MFKLIIEDDEGHTTVVPLAKEEITIGRKEGNTIRLTERNVSRHHARLIRSNGTVFIEDLDSYNGVKVNGGRISARTTIREGDLVEIGDYHLALQQVQDTATPPAEAQQSQPPPIKAGGQAAESPAPTTGDGGTAVLRLPLEEKKAEPGRARPIAEGQAARLVITTTDLAGQVFDLNRTELTLGRTEENDIQLPHRSVSSRHAKIVHDGGIYRIIDLDSANGVLVNGEEYARVDVRKGDVIELGHVKLRYLAPGDDVQTALAEANQAAAGGPAEAAPAPAAAPPRPMVDASLSESRPAGSGLGKWLLIGTIAVLLIGGGGFAIYQLSGGSDGATEPSDEPTAGAGTVDSPGEQPGPGPAPVEPPPDEQGSATPESEAQDYFEQAMAQMKQKEWGLAEQALRSCTKLDPAHKACQQMLEKVLREKEAGTLLVEANKAIERKEWDQALELITEIPEATHAYKLAAGKRTEVIKKYRGLHLNRANQLEQAGKLRGAVEEYDKVLAVDPDNYLAKSKRDKLKRRMAAAARKPRPQRGGKGGEGGRDRRVGQGGGSRQERSAELRGQGVEAYKRKQYSKAISLYKKALRIYPRDYELHRLLGSAYAMLGNRKQAYHQYKKYVKLCPKCMYTPAVRKFLADYEKLQK